MELNNLNLDLSSYTNNDLLNLFSLSNILHNNNFNEQLITNKNNLKNQIQKRDDFKKTYKDKINSFIDAASKKLINENMKNTNSTSHEGTWSQSQNPIIQVGSHIVQEDANRIIGKTASISDGRISGTDNAPPGWLNPINVKTLTTGINIDSRFRDNYYGTTASDFTIDLPVQQNKVISMRIATIDIPMSYYAIQRSRGDSTLLIVNKSSQDTSHCNESGPTFDSYLDLASPNKPKRLTFEEAFSIGTSNFEVNEVIKSKDCRTTDEEPGEYQTAWLVILPDGNYELQWCNKSDAADISNSLNNALACAVRGIFFKRTGRFFAEEDLTVSTDDFIVPNIKNGLDPRLDLCYSVDRISGKSIFSIPESCSDVEAECEAEDSNNVSIFYSCGYSVYFNVQPGGSLSFTSNIQLYLGWQLGFRVAQYSLYRTLACISEAPCMITGPRYMYLCIDDGLKSAGNNFIAAFAQSTLSQDIITRINLANSMSTTGVYKCTSDQGLTNQLNRTREYFGPVTIKKLRFKLLDEYGRTLLFNDVDWSLSVVFEKLYD
tara:strand:+ start:1425 stop:3065 length:1641 start_codon:yes stop_codon:yes gene_type:complete